MIGSGAKNIDLSLAVLTERIWLLGFILLLTSHMKYEIAACIALGYTVVRNFSAHV